jgi:CheY-like chemotaxis protein
MTPLRALIADDHPVFRDGIRALLEATPHTTVVGEATTGEEAVLLAAKVNYHRQRRWLEISHLEGALLPASAGYLDLP